ncbi:MAG: Asp-tRNA(Asn)/Glu-tRNA(Gln) amidotransferase GatCAB subunit B, partial [bacterium]
MEETVSLQVGLEVHIQLKTETKLFCGCPTEFTVTPNVHICPVCLGYPGSLPKMNRKAVEQVLLLSSALKCTIAPASYQSRKNYFYPDLPKGYQISQYQVPIAREGVMEYWHKGTFARCRILRVQLEEDTAKMVHLGGKSLLDYNRAGIPLVEVITAPDFFSIPEVISFLKELRLLLRFLNISDANIEEGSMRCEPNLTVEVNGRKGEKVEIKNLGSFRSVERALQYEVRRQIALLKEGRKVLRQT